MFFVIIDCILGNFTTRYNAVNKLDSVFGVLWKNPNEEADTVRDRAHNLCKEYEVDPSVDLVQELEHLKIIHPANLGQDPLPPLQLLINFKP